MSRMKCSNICEINFWQAIRTEESGEEGDWKGVYRIIGAILHERLLSVHWIIRIRGTIAESGCETAGASLQVEDLRVLSPIAAK